MLAVIGAALAAMIMTSIIALSGGYPALGYAEARAFLGADILVFATPHLVAPGALAQVAGSDQPWSLVALSRDQYCDLHDLHPELYGQGFLAQGGVAARPIDLVKLRARLAGSRFVDDVSAAYFLPVRIQFSVPTEGGGSREVVLNEMILRGRDFGFRSGDGHWSFERLMVDGFVPAGCGDACALLDARLVNLGYPNLPALGDQIRLFVPALSLDDTGRVHLDYSRESEFQLTLAGRYEVQTNLVAWPTELGTMLEELYWTTPQIQVPAEFFSQVFSQASGGRHLLPPAMQVGVTVSPFSEVENIAAELRTLLPEYTVISVPAQLNLAHGRGLPEAVFQAPLEYLGVPTTQQVGMHVDLSQVFIVLVCLIAALLLAANMLFLVAQRRREIGVLKAIGARSGDIGLMILTEALTLNLLGTLAGFALIRIFATWTLLSNRIPLAEIGRATLTDLGLVVTAAASAAAVFGLIPAWQMARLTSMEVLRNE